MSTAPRVTAAKRDWGHDTSGCTILHIDMDAFYASLEAARNPRLLGKPVIIGTGSRSVVSAASYEARKYGVNSAMPTARAQSLCPNGIFLPVDMPYYVSISSRIFKEVFSKITDRVERVSVDECYMDVNSALLRWHSPIVIGEWIRSEVARKFHITCSVGIASNKLIAKMASTNAKPNGMLVVPQNRNADFVSIMPLRAIPGIGPALAKKLAAWGINSIETLRNIDEKTLERIAGSKIVAQMLYNTSRGIDNRQVMPHVPEKSIGTEQTLNSDTTDIAAVKNLIRHCCNDVAQELRKRNMATKTVTLKLRFSDLHYVTRSKTLRNATDSSHELYKHVDALLMDADPIVHNHKLGGNNICLLSPVRLAGVSASNLVKCSKTFIQPTINDILEESKRETVINNDTYKNSTSIRENAVKNTYARISHAEHVLDAVREKYGNNAAQLGI